MQGSKEQLHEVWLKCMQMTDCNQQQALEFLHIVHPLKDKPLTPSKQTLLMLAASLSSVNLVKATLHYKPEPNLKDAIGRTGLHYAAAVGSIQIFELLIAAGCNPNQQTIGGETPLSKACIFGQGQIIEWYLNSSLRTFQIEDRMGKSPLQALKTSGEGLYDEVAKVYQDLKSQGMHE